MKTYATLVLLCAIVYYSNAQDYSVVEHGPHHRKWEKVREVPGPDGTTRQEKSFVVEIEGGLHRWTGKEWAVTDPKIEVFGGGAVARNLQYGAIFAPNLATPEAIDLSLPDGERVKLHLLGLAYTEGNRSVLIAEVKDCAGVIGGPEENELTFNDAFTDFDVSVQFVLQRDRLSQNVIVHQQLPSPTEWGLTENAVLEVLTEFTVFPQVHKEARARIAGTPTEHVSLGSMEFVTGKAFSVGDNHNSVPVSKSWELFEGNRSFLVEKVPWKAIAPELAKLRPVAKEWRKKSEPVMARNLRRAPERLQARAASKPIQTAALRTRPGYVLDFELVTTVNSNLWKGDTTYYISGSVTVKTNIFEGGVVIKYAPTNNAKLTITGPVTCLASPYRPVVCTARDDHTLGESIGSANLSGYYANTALFLDNGTSGILYDLHNFRISHASTAIALNHGWGHTLRNVQVVKCGNAIDGYNYSVGLFNGLISRVETAINASPSASTVTGSLQHVTFNQVSSLAAGTSSWINVFATNSLLVAVTNITTFTGAYNGTNSAPGTTFQTVGGGAHYLAASSPYRNAGTTNIDSTLLGQLRQKTTYPPVVFSNATISAQTTFMPQAQRDTDIPDLGYAYEPLDYAFGGSHGNQNITFTAGTAVGWFRTSSGFFHQGHGLHMADQKIVTFNGRVDAPCYWTRCNTVQEGGTGLWNGGFGTGGITGWASQSGSVTNSPEIRARFTRFSVLSWEGNHFRDDNGYLIARATDCEFWGGGAGGYVISLYLTNCLFDRVQVLQVAGLPGNEVRLRNCTFNAGYLQFYRYYTVPAMPASVHDCAFDRTTIVNDTFGNTDFNYNAYITGSTNLWPIGSTNVMVSDFGWQTGWLGRFYLPTNSAVIDAGSLTNAGLRGLYHYTSTTNQIKETNSVLNMAYHYVALSSPNQAIDTDGDGLADYLEDADGDGTKDAAESDFGVVDTDGDGVSDYLEWLQGRNPNVGAVADTNGVINLRVYSPLK